MVSVDGKKTKEKKMKIKTNFLYFAILLCHISLDIRFNFLIKILNQ